MLKKIASTYVLVITFFLYFTKIIRAQIPFSTLESNIHPTLGNPTPGLIVSRIVGQYVFPIAGFLILIYFITGGFEIMLSAGKPDSVASGKAKMTNAVVGLVVLLTAYWILQILGIVLDIDIIRTMFV